MTLRYLSVDRITPSQTWELATWCLSRGADEFGATLMGLQGSSTPFTDRFEAALKHFSIPDAPRPHPVTYTGQEEVRPAQLWRASSELLEALKQFFTEGLFTYMTSEHEEGWIEDPTFYREGEILLGIVSHEGEGFLNVTSLEAVQVSAMGISTSDAGTWI